MLCKRDKIILLFVILIAWMPLFMGAWIKGEPVEGGLAPDLNNVIRDNNKALEAALDAYIRFATGGTQTGRPRQGSARPYFQDAAPAARLDGDYFDSTDFATIWIDSNATIDNQFNILTAADGAGNETWTPISDEVIAVLLAANRTFAEIVTFSKSPVFTLGIVGNDSYITGRNNAGSANINIAKVNTSDGITLGAVTTVPDTSALATSAAPAADAQIANKKYVDDIAAFSARTANDYTSVTMVKSNVYSAMTDGFVHASYNSASSGDQIIGYVDDVVTDPEGSGEIMDASVANQGSRYIGVSFEVKSGEYFEITATGTPNIYWRSRGALVAPYNWE